MQDATTAGGRELIDRARHRDVAAFSQLVEEFGPDVLRLCMIIAADPAVADDAAQNAWQQAWRRIHTLRENGKIRSWLLRIAANESKQLVRRSRRRRTEPLELAVALPHPGREIEDAEIRDALLSLPAADRELLAYRYVLGFTSEEIGRQLRLSPEGVRSRLKRLRDRLQKEMSDDVE